MIPTSGSATSFARVPAIRDTHERRRILANIHLTRIPTPHGFQILDLFIDGNGIGDYRDLPTLRLPPDIDWSEGVILNGKAPLWLHTWMMARCEKAAWLAVMDPRHGGIVVRAGADGPAPASVIPLASISPSLPRRGPAAPRPEPTARSGAKVVAFVGPPNSGKSVLLRAVHEQLRRLAPEEFQRDTFLLRACPDGEGNWFGEIAADLAATLRYKNRWDDDFVTAMTAQIGTLAASKRLLLVDLGGRIDRRAQAILNCCTSAVIVSRDPAAVSEWRGALQASDVDVVAVIESVQTVTREVLAPEPLHVRLGPLQRGVDVPDLPPELIRAVALPSEGRQG